VGGFGVFGDGGFDGFLGYWTRVAEVDEGGEGVVSGWAVVGGSGGGGEAYGEVVELVFEFEDDTLGCLFADAGDSSEGGVVAGTDGVDEAVGADAAEDRDGQFGTYAADSEELFEEALFLDFGEAEEGELVFADVGVDVEGGFDAFGGQGGEGGYADGDVVAHAGALDDSLIGGFREEAAAEVGDHALVIVAWRESLGCK